jgi:hypothetical protein
MKNVLMISAAVLTATTILLSGCKKDEDDPPIVPNPIGPSLPQSSAQVLHLGLNGSPNANAGNVAIESSNVTWTTDRHGNANSAANFAGGSAGNGQIIHYSGGNFINASTTISVWYKISGTPWPESIFMFGCAGHLGYFFELAADQAWCKYPTSHALTPDPENHNFGTAWTDPNGDGQTNDQIVYEYLAGGNNPTMSEVLGGTEWHQLVMTYDAVTGMKTIYVDNRKLMAINLKAGASDEWKMGNLALTTAGDNDVPVTGQIADLVLGFCNSPDATNPGDYGNYSTSARTFKGALDDFRIWNVALTESEVATLYDYEN